MAIRIITTEDGSQSLYNEELNETYHSTRGAQSESEYIFIQMGLEHICAHRVYSNANPLSVLEIGFGTGLNALLTKKWAEKNKLPVYFHTLEPFPLSQQIVDQLALISDSGFIELHRSAWEVNNTIGEHFTLFKSPISLEAAEIERSFDCIFFDAFAPSKQPEVWGLENLRKCFAFLKVGGVLTTYCAQGQFKRNLVEAGFSIEVLPGALGKKEMVRARKKGR